jgi:hypothetical protein
MLDAVDGFTLENLGVYAATRLIPVVGWPHIFVPLAAATGLDAMGRWVAEVPADETRHADGFRGLAACLVASTAGRAPDGVAFALEVEPHGQDDGLIVVVVAQPSPDGPVVASSLLRFHITGGGVIEWLPAPFPPTLRAAGPVVDVARGILTGTWP